MNYSAAMRLADSNEGERSDRRLAHRHKLVLRVGILEGEGSSLFCLIKNISAYGVQVKVYGRVEVGASIQLRVCDEDPVSARVVWSRSPLVGIKFDTPLAPDALLRVEQKPGFTRRRGSPRVTAAAKAIFRTGGQTYASEVCDISTSGARIRTKRPLTSQGLAVLDLPNMPPLNCFVRWSDDCETGLSFVTPLPIEVIAAWLGQWSAVKVS